MDWLAITLIVFGILVLVFGSRLWLLGAAVGALLGIGLLRFVPGAQTGVLGWLLPVGLAIAFGFGAVFLKAIVDIIILVLGVLAGAAIALAFLNLFNVSAGLLDWVAVIVGGLLGAVLIGRFKRWALVILAGLIGALLTVWGLQLLFPSLLTGPFATLITLALAGGGIFYQGRSLGRE
jgi:hypothetical protein